MKVTIFTSCYNQAPYLKECIESVLCQTHTDFEYLLIDDGSTDNTKNIIKEYSKRDERIKLIYLSKYPNIGSVINFSISIMKGNYWVWVPSDDLILPALIENKLKISDDNTITLGWGDSIDENSKYLGSLKFSFKSNSEFISRIWNECFIGMTGVMIPINLFNRIGVFPEHLKFSEDYYWILKSTQFDSVNYKYVPEILYKKRLHNIRLSNQYSSEIIANIPLIKKEVKDIYGR